MDDFYNEEIRSGYLVSKEIKKLWAVELDLLERFVKVCDENGLVYYAMFGTMLGAVRHGGFVPWDDDIDVVMPRKDYDRLMKMRVFEEPYFLQTPENDPSGCPRFMRLRNIATTHIPSRWPDSMTRGGKMGIGIDIMPLDGIPFSCMAKKLAKSAAKCHKLRLLRAAIDESGWENIPEWKQELCEKAKDKTYDGLTKRYHAICSRYSGIKPLARYFTIPVLEGDRLGIVLNKKDFSGRVYMDFERLSIAVPSGYKNIIGTLWEGGMDMPEKVQRRPQHDGIIDTERPYTEYMSAYTDTFKNLDGKRVLLFGAGNMLKIYMERFGKRFPPICTFDNDRRKWGKLSFGVKVCPPEELPAMMDGNTRLIIISLYHRDIAEKLCIMGISEYYVFIDGWNYGIGG